MPHLCFATRCLNLNKPPRASEVHRWHINASFAESDAPPLSPTDGRDAKEGSSKAGIESSLSDLADSLDGAATDSTAPRAQIPASLANAPLRIIFYKAKEMAQKITNPDSTSPCSVSDTDLALALLAKSRELIQSASVFSSNETVSDVNTSDLGYLLAPFYQGQILTKCSNLEVRADKLKEAINYLTEFVEGCLKMEVVSSDQTVAACRRALEGGMPDVSVTRQDRLDRHKREKEIKERLDFLQAKRQGAMSSRGDGDGDDDDEDEEEEGERELITLMLEQSLGKTVTDLPLYKQEIELLAMRKAMGGAGPPRDARGFTGGAAAGRGGGMQTMHIPKGALSGSMIPQAPQLGKGRIVVDGATAADRRAQMQEVATLLPCKPNFPSGRLQRRLAKLNAKAIGFP